MPKIKKRMTVEAPVDVVYRAWHNFENFPRFMSNVQDVRVVSRGKSHWKARLPLSPPAEWDAEMTLDEPNKAIGWRSIGGPRSGVENAGRVNFEPHGRFTDLELTLDYEPPGGLLGSIIAKVIANPERRVEDDLWRFKETIERGVELSGLRLETPSGESYGGSLGANTAADLRRTEASNTGVAPTEIDEPSTRQDGSR
jgi:uncharacterized membrane protein